MIWIFFGDNITAGVGDTQKQGWVERLTHETLFNNDSFINQGVNGEHLVLLSKRIQAILENIDTSQEISIVFSYGTNDLAKFNGNHLVSLSKFEKTYQAIIDITKSINPKIYLTTILPIGSNTEGIKTEYGFLRRTEIIEKYNTIIRELAHKNKILLVDWYDDFNLEKETLLSEDSLHPNTKGHEWLKNYFIAFLSKSPI